MSETMQVVNDQGRPFTVRIVREGEGYGRDQKLVHTDAVPMVEFYDATVKDEPGFDQGLGQFVSRYGADTLQGTHSATRGRHTGGITLDGSVKAWSLDAAAMTRVMDWLDETLDEQPHPGM